LEFSLWWVVKIVLIAAMLAVVLDMLLERSRRQR
jgi:hypothetical protein